MKEFLAKYKQFIVLTFIIAYLLSFLFMTFYVRINTQNYRVDLKITGIEQIDKIKSAFTYNFKMSFNSYNIFNSYSITVPLFLITNICAIIFLMLKKYKTTLIFLLFNIFLLINIVYECKYHWLNWKIGSSFWVILVLTILSSFILIIDKIHLPQSKSSRMTELEKRIEDLENKN